jgi:hypothetical protein
MRIEGACETVTSMPRGDQTLIEMKEMKEGDFDCQREPASASGSQQNRHGFVKSALNPRFSVGLVPKKGLAFRAPGIYLNQRYLCAYALECIGLTLAFHSSYSQRLPVADNIENGRK